MAGGTVAISGAAAMAGRHLDRYEFAIGARDLVLNPEQGVELALSADAQLDWNRDRRIPLLHGTLRLNRVVYTRPFSLLALSLDELSRRTRAEVERYDPDADRIELDLRLVDRRPIRVVNNLIDAELRIQDSEGPFRIVGTDQRFGALGALAITRGGAIQFRNAEFEVQRGVIRFDDSFRVDPNFDVLAVTDVRRTSGLTSPSWRITLHAHGNRDSFRLDTSSEPELSQEDIALLLTVGMTRAEAEQLQNDVTGTLALEALATVTGIDREVRRAVPVIDDFRIISRYSPQTNRTEPHISIGKRIADRLRLTASTGISEYRELQASVEWQLNEQTSVQAVYDNVNTTTASTVGNVGVDLRWRLEFE